MFDTLPFPNMTAKDAEERSKQTIDYLLQLREELVFILDSIVSGDFSKVTTQTEAVKALEEISNASGNELTVAEVINSAAFKASLNGVKETIPTEINKGLAKIKFTVNFDTGNLEYTTS